MLELDAAGSHCSRPDGAAANALILREDRTPLVVPHLA
jgi:hypothetical protein